MERGKAFRAGLALALLLSLGLVPAGVPPAGAAETWTAQASGTDQALLGVAAVDANTAWAVGGFGTILKTTNGGSTWTAQTSGTGADLWGVAALDANTAWAVGHAGTILKTTNGGTTWTAQFSGITHLLYGVAAVDANTAWAVGGFGTILKTTNGGSTWTAQTSGITQVLYGVAAVDANTAWAVGVFSTILKTTNGGTTWTAQTSGTANLNGVAKGGTSLWAVGDGGTILKANLVQAGSQPLSQSVSVQIVSLSLTLSTSSINYGPVPKGGSAVSPTITATNTSGTAVNFSLQGANATAAVAGESNWTLGPNPGIDVYSNDFADPGTVLFTALTTNATTLTTNVANNGTKSFVLRVRIPTDTTGTGVRSWVVTVIATAP